MAIRGSWYRDGSDWIVVVSGMPEQNVKVGVGNTLREAWENLQATAIQSVGRDGGEEDALSWAHGAGWCAELKPEASAVTIHIEGGGEATADMEQAALEAWEAWRDGETWLEPADEEAEQEAMQLDEPVGDVEWRDGIGQDELGLWWAWDADDNVCGPFATEEEAQG